MSAVLRQLRRLYRTTRDAAAVARSRSYRLIARAPHSPISARFRRARTRIEEDSFRLRNLYRVASPTVVSDERFIICADVNDIFSGLGCALFVLAPCWKYALDTGRTLVIDWRGNPYTRSDPQRNLFSLLFEPPDLSRLGVRCIADDSVNSLRIPQPILGPAEGFEQENGAIDKLPSGGLDLADMRRILALRIDVECGTIIPSLKAAFHVATRFGPLGPRVPSSFSFDEARRLYGGLQPLPRWQAVISDFHREHLAGRRVIGVHIRHGNGEAEYRNHFRGREITDTFTFVASVAAKIRRYAAHRFGDGRPTVFLCTDSDEMVNAMATHFPTMVSRRVWRPPPGEGLDFDHAYKLPDGGVGAAADALIDMQLLARCDAVLLTRRTAFASHVPYILEKPGATFLNHERVMAL